uniref:Uncharacterized protein n=1 Tax=Rhizophora mucronata TaxID=61149 RepID=A0A2P2N6P3_RHIMU
MESPLSLEKNESCQNHYRNLGQI